MWFKQVIVTLLSMGFLWSMAPVAAPPSIQVAQTSITTPKVIRFRVIANSDNPVDQAVKLDVRDAVLRILEPRLDHVATYGQAQKILQTIKSKIDRTADQVLAYQGVPYRARVSLGMTVFPTKAYGSWVLPAGHYMALLITLGRGDGHNWWCVLFPSLCFIDMGNALAVPYSTTVTPRTSSPPPSVPWSPSPSAVSPLSGRIRVSWAIPRPIRDFLNWL